MAVDLRDKEGRIASVGPRLAVTDGRGGDLFGFVGLAAVVFSVIYFVSDVIELAQGGFSTTQLVLTHTGEAAIPLFVIGLYAAQRPQIGRLGLVGAEGVRVRLRLLHGDGVVRARGTRPELGHARASDGSLGHSPRRADGSRWSGLRVVRGSGPCVSALDRSGADGRRGTGGGLFRAPRGCTDGPRGCSGRRVGWDGGIAMAGPPRAAPREG